MISYYNGRLAPAKHVKRLGSNHWNHKAQRLQTRLRTRTWLLIVREGKAFGSSCNEPDSVIKTLVKRYSDIDTRPTSLGHLGS